MRINSKLLRKKLAFDNSTQKTLPIKALEKPFNLIMHYWGNCRKYDRDVAFREGDRLFTNLLTSYYVNSIIPSSNNSYYIGLISPLYQGSPQQYLRNRKERHLRKLSKSQSLHMK